MNGEDSIPNMIKETATFS